MPTEVHGRGFPDRRRAPTPPVSRFWLLGRRRGGRRTGEERNIYVDRYAPGEWALVAGILALSALDLFLTLRHVGNGGREANPVMAWFLSMGPDAFGLVKLLTTFAGLVILLAHVKFRRVRGLLVLALALYAAVMVWHGYVAVDAA